MTAMQTDGAFRNLLVDSNDIKAVQKVARRSFEVALGSNHHLHPSDDADRLFCVVSKLGARLRNSIEVVDQSVGVGVK